MKTYSKRRINLVDLSEYQKKARSTAIYTDIENSRMIYPALGIIGECGEVSDKIKKLIRDNNWNMTDNRKSAIGKELGDCCWYLANICCETCLDLSMIYEMRGAYIIHKVRTLMLPQLVLHMNQHAIAVANALQEWYYKFGGRPNERDRFIEIPDHLSHIISCVEEIGRRCDFTLEAICVANIENLTGRKERGTLKGNGDDR
jgi:NTP pyrophosphatase (non-canonical NTP hydrolase)